MKYLTPLCLLAIVVGLLFGLGAFGKAQPNLEVAIAGELSTSEHSFTIAPAKYVYSYIAIEVVDVTVRNLTDKDAKFDMGDGCTITVLASSSLSYQYRVKLDGSTIRIPITKEVECLWGVCKQERLNLKIEPRTKGGDTR